MAGERDSASIDSEGVRPGGFMMLACLFLGLFVSWWASFHEIACGCISIRAHVPLLYTYFSCYAHSLGCLAGVMLALRIARPCNPAALVRAGMASIGILMLATLAFYGSLVLESWVLATIIQMVINMLAIVVIFMGLAAFSGLPRSDAVLMLFWVVVIYALFNNLLLPPLVTLIGQFYLVTAAQMAILASCLFILPRLGADGRFGSICEKSMTWAIVEKEHEHIPWQPILFVAIYSVVFGLMHVESSSLINSFYDRNLPYAAGAAIAVLMFYLTFIRKASTPRVWPKARSVVFPLTAISFMLLPCLDTVTSFLPITFINCSYLYYDLFFVLGCLAIAGDSHITYLRAFAIGVGVRSAGYLIGTVLCHLQINFLAGDVLRTPIATVLVFLLLVVATFWVGDDQRAKKIWGARIELTPKMAGEAKLQDKCDIIAKNYKLSPKEREVIFLLAGGKTTEQVSDELFISIYTTRTHIRNAYAKLDVHSRGELAKLVEGVEADGLGAGVL